ncbi:hypothetical protein [Mycobacteroides abscessus]|uniref:hypothetical protein n=1 Tax=Mycobacteroides abscessus TaxID=36809 RepID=UPI003AF87C8B
MSGSDSISGCAPCRGSGARCRAILSVQAPTADEVEDAAHEGREPVSLWTHRAVCIECTRQQGKTLLIVLLILFHMCVLRSKRIIYTAQRWSTAYDVFKRVCAVIDRVPWLKSRLAEKPSKGGNRGVIKLKDPDTGQIVCEVEFGPHSQDFGRGYTEIDLLIIDEAYDVDPEEEQNLTGSQSAAKNPQTIYISTAPVASKHPKCHSLAGLHRLGHGRAPDLYYALYAAPRRPVWLAKLVRNVNVRNDFYAVAPDNIRPAFYAIIVQAELELPFFVHVLRIAVPIITDWATAALPIIGPLLGGFGPMAQMGLGMISGLQGIGQNPLFGNLMGQAGSSRDTKVDDDLRRLLSPTGVLQNIPGLIALIAALPGLQAHGEYHLPKTEFGGRDGIAVAYDIIAGFRR